MSKPVMALMMVMLLAATLGWGQQPITFNVAHTAPSGSYAVGYGVHVRTDGYLVFGLQNSATTPQDLHTYTFNENGELQSIKAFSHPRLQWIGSYAPVTKLMAGGYACGLSHFGGGMPISELHLYRFNEEGDTLWTRFLITDTTVAIRKCIEAANGDLLLTGFYEFPRGTFIYRLTADGDSVMFKNLVSPVFEGSSVAEGADGNLYLCGVSQDENPEEHNKATLVKLSSSGSFVWRRSWPRSSAYAQVIPTMDNSTLALGSYATPLQEWPFWTFTKALVVKYDADGNLLWYADPIQTDNSNRPCAFLDGLELPGGDLVACGQYRSTATLDRGMLFKFTSDGEELWRRFYRWYDGPFNGNEQIFNDVEPTSDGGFILTGSTDRMIDTSFTYPPKLWLVKLDSMGCLVPGCNTVGIEEQALDLNQYLRIFPNPIAAGQALQFTFEPPADIAPQGSLRVVLLDATGRMVHEERLSGGPGSVPLSLGEGLRVRAGLYYLHLTDGARWLAGGKVVVQ